MGKLNIDIARSEWTLSKIYELEDLADEYHDREDGRIFGIGFSEGNCAGYWSGISYNNEDVFWSTKIFIKEKFRGKGYGVDLKMHQLEFAKNSGYRDLKAMVPLDNLVSCAVQEKCGGERIGPFENILVYRFKLSKI